MLDDAVLLPMAREFRLLDQTILSVVGYGKYVSNKYILFQPEPNTP